MALPGCWSAGSPGLRGIRQGYDDPQTPELDWGHHSRRRGSESKSLRGWAGRRPRSARPCVEGTSVARPWALPTCFGLAVQLSQRSQRSQRSSRQLCGFLFAGCTHRCTSTVVAISIPQMQASDSLFRQISFRGPAFPNAFSRHVTPHVDRTAKSTSLSTLLASISKSPLPTANSRQQQNGVPPRLGPARARGRY